MAGSLGQAAPDSFAADLRAGPGPGLGRGMRVIGIGELLWDLLPAGPRLGGAPFNVVAHMRRLGFQARYVSAVGRDPLGERAISEVRRLGIGASLVQSSDLPTGTVRVELDSCGVPAFEIVSPAAYETIGPKDLPPDLGGFDVLVFGSLAQRFPGVIAATRLLARAGARAVRLYDVNLRQGCWTSSLVDELMKLATMVKLNESEAATIASELAIHAASTEVFARALAARYDLLGVCVTRGADGAALLLDDVFCEVPAVPVTVADTVGAGDAFAAGLAACVVWRWPIKATLDLSSHLAALVASRQGAIPDWDLSELALPASQSATR